MNTLARQVPMAAVLGALLFLSGCFTTDTAGKAPVKAPPQFTVVESSEGLELTPELLADLRRSVAQYLKDEGYTQEGEYMVRVNLNPEKTGEVAHWVVVRVTSQPRRTFTMLAAYPGADDFYPYDYYGYYDYGYPGFARYGYYDPLDFGWGYGGYYAPVPVAPPRMHKPGEKHPPGTPTRWDGNRPDQNRPRSNDRPPGSGGSRNWSRDRGDNSPPSGRPDRGSHSQPPSGSYSPPPSYSPPAAQSYSPPPASWSPSPQVNSDSSRHSPRTEEK